MTIFKPCNKRSVGWGCPICRTFRSTANQKKTGLIASGSIVPGCVFRIRMKVQTINP